METKNKTGKRQVETYQVTGEAQKDKVKCRERKISLKKRGQSLHLKVSNSNIHGKEFTELVHDIVRDNIVIKNVLSGNGYLVCVVETDSSKKAKDIIFAIHQHNKKSDIKIMVTKHEKPTHIVPGKQCLISDEENVLLEIMDTEARTTLSKHNEIITEIISRIQIITDEINIKSFATNEKSNSTVSPFSHDTTDNPLAEDDVKKTLLSKQEEIDALHDKRLELELQKKEFKDFTSCINNMLQKVKKSKNLNSALKLIYSEFKVECTHLSSALPMYARRTEITTMVTDNQVSIILGETGSGKSTQVAQYLYQAGFANSGLIVCTQPRKIAASSLATRVAQEMGTSVGNIVGYQVGMQMKMSQVTKIIYMTDQMLLNLCLKDECFSKYACIIIDEAHERSIYTDLLLGMIKTCLDKRPELRVVITSATIEPKIFVKYFGTCPVLKVAGRMFPVDVIWPSEKELIEDNYERAALRQSLFVHEKEEDGDILTFLTSPLEVERCCFNFEKSAKDKHNFICLPLHGRLQALEQQKVFESAPIGKRKIVFATNTAETSITIPGIKYVIDTGVAKEMQFDPQKNISALNTTTITKSSAEQRKGRAGRTASGKCFRLYLEDTYRKMNSNSKPEILRIHLGHALLKLFELGVNPLQFDFVEAPSKDLMNSAMETLEEVGAVLGEKITERGKWIAKLPIDPKFGAFVHEAVNDGVGIEAIILTASSGTSGVFYRSGTDSEKNRADQHKVRFCHEGGDFMTMLNVFREWHDQPEKSKGEWCCKNSINGKVVRGIRENVNEILNTLKKELGIHLKFVLKSPKNIDEKLQNMLFRMFKQNIGHYLGHEKAGYLVVHKEQNVQIFPASSLISLGSQPNWIVIERVLKTSRDFASNVTPVKDVWIKEALETGLLKLDIETIQNHKIEQVVFYEVGQKLYADFVGVCHSELRNLQNCIKKKCGGNLAIIEASKEYGEISVYTKPQNAHIAISMVDERISLFRKKLKDATSEQNLSLSKSSVKVVIGAGLNLVDVVMPNEYRTIVVVVKDSLSSEKQIREFFEKWGRIDSLYKFRNSKEKTKWGKVTFMKKEDAERAIAAMKDDGCIAPIGGIPDKGMEIPNIPKKGYMMRAKLEWCRRPMFAFIKFSNSAVVKQVCKASIVINGSRLRIRQSKTNTSEVHILNFNSNTKEEDLRQAFEIKLPLLKDSIEKITMRSKSVKTSEDELTSLKQTIERKLREYVKEGEFTLDLKTPKDHHNTFLGFISFTIPEEGLLAYVGINNTFKINYELVTMTPEFKTTVVIPKFLFPTYKDTVENFSKNLDETLSAKCRSKELKNGNVLVELVSEEKETVLQAKQIIQSAVNGKKYGKDDIDDIEVLFTWDGKAFIDKVKKQTNTIIMADSRVFVITIHGSKDNTSKAIKALIEYIRDRKTGVSKQLVLKGPDKPAGIMKELMLRYGFDLSKLKEENELKYIELDRRRHILTMAGELKVVDKVIEVVQTVIEGVVKKGKCNEHLQSVKTRDCVVCFCPIEEGELYRLEICGHSYCKDCIKFQFQSHIESNEFPVCCSSDGCGENWALKDVMTMMEKNEYQLNVLVEKATSSFVAKNQKAYKYCTTPDCPIIYRVSKIETPFTCPQCEMCVCTACDKQFHDDLTCEDAKRKEEAEKENDLTDMKFQEWIQNTANVKQCPNCSTIIEKISGCNRMACASCHTHICWVCLSHYTTAGDCYEHLSSVHGSVY